MAPRAWPHTVRVVQGHLALCREGPYTLESARLEDSEPAGWPAGAPTIVVVQTVAEDRGFPVPVKSPDEPLPPARLSLTAVGRLIVMPYCEILSWPLAVVGWLLGPPKKPTTSG